LKNKIYFTNTTKLKPPSLEPFSISSSIKLHTNGFAVSTHSSFIYILNSLGKEFAILIKGYEKDRRPISQVLRLKLDKNV